MQNGQTPFEITKANGEKSVFEPNKLFTSLTRSGADETQAYDSLGLYPITTLTSLTLTEKKALLKLNLVLCHDLKTNQDALNQIGIKAPRIKTILEECFNLCYRVAQSVPSHT